MVNNHWLLVSNMTLEFSISSLGCHPNPIDELHDFSEGSTSNQRGWENHPVDIPGSKTSRYVNVAFFRLNSGWIFPEILA